jgi:hypothetical protein
MMKLLWSVVVMVLLLSMATGGVAVGRNVESASVRKRRGDDIYQGDIVGGTRLSNADIPSYYAVSVPPYALCGAVLIHAKYLLTAAHCHTAFIHSARLVASGTVVPIRQQHVHPRYNESDDIARFHFDLMVLELEYAVTDAPILRSYDNDNNVTSTKEVWTLGYGVTTTTTTNNASSATTVLRLRSETLQHVNLTVISIDECAAAYATIGLAERIDAARVFCTYDYHADNVEVRRDACYGDSGSPVVTMVPNDDDDERNDDDGIGSQHHHHRLVGVVSWGRDCAGDFPAVHMKVDMDFVESIVPPCDDDDDDDTAVATATANNSTSGYNDGYYSFHYWQYDDETQEESRCIDLTVNRMFRFWKSMNFTCGSCHNSNNTAARRRRQEGRNNDDQL